MIPLFLTHIVALGSTNITYDRIIVTFDGSLIFYPHQMVLTSH